MDIFKIEDNASDADNKEDTGIDGGDGGKGGGGNGGKKGDYKKVYKKKPYSKVKKTVTQVKKTSTHGKDVKKLKRTAKHFSHRGFAVSEQPEGDEDYRQLEFNQAEFNQAYNEIVHGFKDE
jgi:hypothetical protein